jgi:ribosome biogenesis GTPase A
MHEEEIARRNNPHTAALQQTTVTPFEKNLEVWRQLWRVLERSACVVQIVDARNPLFYLSQDLRQYATVDLKKPMLVVVNKSDYLSAAQRQHWYTFLTEQAGWTDVVFFSAAMEQTKLDRAAQEARRHEDELEHALRTPSTVKGSKPLVEGEDESDEDDPAEDDVEQDLGPETPEGHDDDLSSIGDDITDADGIERDESDPRGVHVLLNRNELTQAMRDFAIRHDCSPDPKYDDRIQFGMVGFPNVGKSSVINVLVGSSKHSHGYVRVAVANQPGKTKHFQTVLLPDIDDVMLCDCPGLVFPSFVSNTADLIAAGVYPIAQMRDHWPVVSLICERIPREIINAHYGIQLPEPSIHELRERGLSSLPPPTAEELLTTYCIARGMLAAASGVPDYQRASRTIIKDYADGKLLYCHPPPSLSVDSEAMGQFYDETIITALQNTNRLREKLLRQQQQQERESGLGGDEQARNEDDDESTDSGEDLTDSLLNDDILDFVDGGDNVSRAAKPKREHKTKQKWGKKGRKLRDKDPYGCHIDPDRMLSDVASHQNSAGGVIVRAGKHTRSGYTRQLGHGAGSRGIIVLNSSVVS